MPHDDDELVAGILAELLRVLEQREITRLGSTTPIPVDIRVLAATNKNLVEEVAERRFREDLYFRLKVVSVDLPPLRDRVADIPFLVDTFVRELAARHETPVESASPEVVSILQAQPWPGNVRELRNVVEFMVVTAGVPVLEPQHLPAPMQGAEGVAPALPSGTSLAGMTAREVEREHIRATLEAVGGNRAQAARMMEIGERTLYRKIKEYDL